jgi:hypothetical protein
MGSTRRLLSLPPPSPHFIMPTTRPPSVDSPDIASVQLIKPLPFAARVYAGVWVPIYFTAYHAFYNRYDDWIKSIGTLTFIGPKGRGRSRCRTTTGRKGGGGWKEGLMATEGCCTDAGLCAEWTFLFSILLFGGHALSFLFTKWSMTFRSWAEARRVRLRAFHLYYRMLTMMRRRRSTRSKRRRRSWFSRSFTVERRNSATWSGLSCVLLRNFSLETMLSTHS